MASSILLINFEEKYAEKMTNELKVRVDRGYFSNVISFKESGDHLVEEINIYLPHPVYEYKVVFANLSSNEILDDEFRQKASTIRPAIRGDFFNYWSKNKGIIIIFLGNYGYTGLLNFGIPKLSLEEVFAEDITANSDLEEDSSFKIALRKLEKHIAMPTNKYISIDEKIKAGENWVMVPIYINLRGWILGCYYNDSQWRDKTYPSFLILPQFKDNLYVIKILLKEIAKIYPKFLPDLYEPDWLKSDNYYPKELQDYSKKIEDYKRKIESKIKELIEEKEQSKKRYENLRGILYEKGDKLKRNIIEVLEKYWSFNVTDMDKNKKKNLKEDILIEEGSRKILVEVKGTNSTYPSPTFLTQTWKHIYQSGLGDQAEGALILNYDIKTEPKERSLAYTGEDESQLEDIIFIDTRILFDLTLSIIDDGLYLEDAKKILLSRGRVKFDIDDYKQHHSIKMPEKNIK